MSLFAERTWTAPDGLALFARDYAAAPGPARLPVVCLHGLTRNSRDFEAVAPWLAARGRRVLALDIGRVARILDRLLDHRRRRCREGRGDMGEVDARETEPLGSRSARPILRDLRAAGGQYARGQGCGQFPVDPITLLFT